MMFPISRRAWWRCCCRLGGSQPAQRLAVTRGDQHQQDRVEVALDGYRDAAESVLVGRLPDGVEQR